MDKVTNILKIRYLNMIGTDLKNAIATVIFVAALLTPALACAVCTKLIDKHLEYFKGIKEHLPDSPNFDPGIKKIPYDVKIIDNTAQQYALLTSNISFFYPNTTDRPINFGFEDASGNLSGYIPALCIIKTPDGSKWVVWKDDLRVYFFDEDEQPH